METKIFKHSSKLLFIHLALFICSCNGNSRISESYESIPTINLDLASLEVVHFDSVATNVRFIPLETTKDCLIEKYDDIRIIGQKIYVKSSSGIQNAIFVFDLNGKFLFKIDNQGRGPGEYNAISSFYVDPDLERIGIIDQLKVVVYDFNGKYIMSHTFTDLYPDKDAISSSGKYYTTAFEYEKIMASGKDSKSEIVAVFDADWNLLWRDYPVNINIITTIYSGEQKQLFIPVGDRLYFLHTHSNIIYEFVTNTMEPAFRIDYGSHTVSDEELRLLLELEVKDYYKSIINKNLWIPGSTSLFMTGNHILISTSIGKSVINGLYNRNSGECVKLDMSVAWGNLMPGRIMCNENIFFGIIEPAIINRIAKDINTGNVLVSELRSQFSPSKMESFHHYQINDNAVIVFFDLKDQFFKSDRAESPLKNE